AAAASATLPAPWLRGALRVVSAPTEAVAQVYGRVAPSQKRPHSFYFTRAIYSGGRGAFGWGGQSWRTDYPKADRQFLTVLTRLSNLDAYGYEHPVAIDDPEVRRYPFLYAV